MIFDKDSNGSITPQEMKDTVTGIYKDRKALSASLRDVGSAVGKLDNVFTCAALILSLLMVLLIFGVAVGPFLVTSMSMILAVTYAIGYFYPDLIFSIGSSLEAPLKICLRVSSFCKQL